METQKEGYAIVGLDEFIEAKALPPQISAQKAELTALLSALVRTLQLGKEKKLNIFTDSKYGFHVICDTCSCWHVEKREMLTDRYNPPQNIQIWSWLF